ncbi:MAG: M20/M25/M40 family metallo-hydrolase, partial [Bacteroidia bacterium]|nr:M20/M25/M40 family metallo-hydrolase [Bacteroidia bacterium]
IKALKDLKVPTKVIPVVLINSDEEIGSRETREIIKRISRLSNRAFVLEPPLGPEGKLKTSRKGIGSFTIKVKGKAAHAGLDPGKGVNAIVELAHQVQKLHAMNDFQRGTTVNVGMIEGGQSVNVVAPESRAVIDVRVANMEDARKITEQIKGLKPKLKDVELIVEGEIGRPPMIQTERNRQLWLRAKANAEILGFAIDEANAGGGSDGNFTSQFTATLDGLGTVGDGAHAAHEFIFKDTIIERTALLTLLLMEEPIVH